MLLPMKYSHLIFDIDGTLIDTERTGVLSLQKTIRDLMGKDMPYDEVYPYFGIPSHRVGPMLGYEDDNLFLHTWEQNFIDMRYMMKIFPGVVEMLEELREQGIVMGVATSRSHFELYEDPAFATIKHLFEIFVSSEDTVKHKPDPDPALEFIRQASVKAGREVKAEECLYLGDTAHDFSCARGAGCDFALADWKKRGMQGIDAEYHFTDVDGIRRIVLF